MKILSTELTANGFEVIVNQAKLSQLTNFISYNLRDENDNELDYKNHKEIVSLSLTIKQYNTLDDELGEILKGKVKRVENKSPQLIEQQKCELLYMYKHIIKVQTLDRYINNDNSEEDVQFADEILGLLSLQKTFNNQDSIKITVDRLTHSNVTVHLPTRKDTGDFLDGLVNLISNHYPEINYLTKFSKKIKRFNPDYNIGESKDIHNARRRYPTSYDNNLLNAYHAYILLPYIRTLKQFPYSNLEEWAISERQGGFIYDFFNLMSKYDKDFDKLLGDNMKFTEREFVKNLRRQLEYLKRDFLDA